MIIHIKESVELLRNFEKLPFSAYVSNNLLLYEYFRTVPDLHITMIYSLKLFEFVFYLLRICAFCRHPSVCQLVTATVFYIVVNLTCYNLQSLTKLKDIR